MEVVAPSAERQHRLAHLEAVLRDWLGEPCPAPPSGRGRPPIVPAAVLWSGLLVCVLRGFESQRDLWRLLTQHGFWQQPCYEVSDMAIYDRLKTAPATALAPLLSQLTAALPEATPPDPNLGTSLAAFAPAVLAIDHTVLDPVLRRRKLLRELPIGDHCLLPGALGCVFDVRRQRWVKVHYLADPQQDLHADIVPLVAGLPLGSLLLFDLGYFSFWFLDELTQQQYHFVTRWREKTTYEVAHVLYDGGNAQVHLWEGLVYPGKHRADRAAQPVRLIRLTRNEGERSVCYQYVTNVLDPRVLPAWEVVALYRRRWDIEQAFNLIKTYLGLHLLWSSHPNVILHQVYATVILCQVLFALRDEVALRAQAGRCEVSLPLLIRWLPRLAADGHDPVAEFVRVGRSAGYVRPVRRRPFQVPEVPISAYCFPEHPPNPRSARYGSHDYCERTYVPDAEKAARRARYWAGVQDRQL